MVLEQHQPTKISIGNAVLECFLSTRRAGKTLRNTCETRKSIIKRMTFQEEFLMFLKRYEVEYDEQYVWD